jgi:hypothetical protein
MRRMRPRFLKGLLVDISLLLTILIISTNRIYFPMGSIDCLYFRVFCQSSVSRSSSAPISLASVKD